MPNPENNGRFDEVVDAVRALTAIRPDPGRGAQGNGDGVFVPDGVDRITYHDFALYETVFDPWATRDPGKTDDPGKPEPPPAETAPPPPDYLPTDLEGFEDLSYQAEAVIAYFLDNELREALEDGVAFDPAPIIQLLHRFRATCYDELIRHYTPDRVSFRVEWILVRVEAMLMFFVENFLADLLEPFSIMNERQQDQFFADYYDRAVRDWAIRMRNMELPSLVGGHGTMQDWTDAGYVLGDIIGRVPTRLSSATYPPHGVRRIEGYVTNPEGGPDPLAHEHAWTHNRYGRFGGTGFLNALQDSDSLYFARRQIYTNGGPREHSDVLAGALDILNLPAPPTQSELDSLTAAAREELGEYGNVIGGTSATPETARDLYGFEPYPAASINLGIRVLYRQAWRPRGIQPGELVRTIPLAPGQKERFSVKYTRRNKQTREIEEARSTETTEESVSQTKDSSEIVEEAAHSNKWHLDTTASGSFNMGAWGVEASTSAGYASESSKASKDTKSRLSEAMQKTARRSRRENKVKVSTEREETFETERSTEITNPNQEIAVTCFYETVQQIYTVKTALEGIDPVLFVAERVPSPEELNVDWIRRYDWIISRALLDESFRDTLQLLSTQEPDFFEALSAEALGLDEVARLSKVLDKAEASLATIHELDGSIANTYEATLQAYQTAVATSRARLEQVHQLLQRVSRLRNHLADNILHYCRAIWSAEDPDRRMMRYASLRLPTRFRPSMNLQNVQTDPLTGETIYTGAWEADPTSWKQLSEVIHPAGPIAYAGNYAVYRIRYIESTAGLSRVIRLAHQAYYEPRPPAIQISPANRAAALNVTATIENEDFYSGDSYVLRVSNPPPPPPAQPPAGVGSGPNFGGVVGPVAPDGLQYVLIRREFDGAATDLTALSPNGGRIPPNMIGLFQLEFDGVRLVVGGQFQAGDEIVLIPRPPILVDPEVKYRRLLDPQLPLDQIQQQIEDENTDDVVIDTNNLWLNLVKGTGTVLEDFKLEHRKIDVELARAELVRHYLRLDQNVLADPDIEKKVIIRGPASARRIAEGEAIEEDGARSAPIPAAPAVPPGG